MSLTYRPFEERDLPGVLRLWEEDSGWGGLTPEVWRQWHLETPNGPCLVIVAEDEEGEIAGQLVFTPSRVVVNGEEERALRLAAPILRKDHRRLSLRNAKHPTIGLLLAGTEAAIQRGYALVYSLPERGWLPFFRWMSRVGLPAYTDAEYQCVTLSVPSTWPAAACARSLATSRANEFGAEYDRLWENAKTRFPIRNGVVRSPEWLRYRHGAHLTLEMRDAEAGDLAGFVVIRPRDGLIVDALARDQGEMTPVLAAALQWLTDEPDARDCIAVDVVKAMCTDAMRTALRALGFSCIDYKFAFVSHSLVKRIPATAITPDRWYIAPGD